MRLEALARQVMGQARPVGRHPVARFHGAKGARVLVGSVVAHDAYRTNGQQHRKGLPHLPIEAGGLYLLDEDGIGLPQEQEPVPGDRAQAPNGKPGARKGLAVDEVLVEAQLEPHAPHLVLEELP